MAQQFKSLKDRAELNALIAKSISAYKSMNSEQKRLMHEAQRRSWVVGNMMLDHPEMTREYVEGIYDRASQ